MLIFIIPVKSQKVSGDWEKFSKLFERCLRSVCNQTNTEYLVIVSCHEKPSISFNNDKIIYNTVSFPVPALQNKDRETQRRLKEGDKAKKIQDGLKIAGQYHPTYVMVVDSDDCISNKIVEFVLKNQNGVPGWYIKKGYYYQEGKPYAFLNTSNFNQFCGSCIIIKYKYADKLILKDPFLYYDHHTMLINKNTVLQPLPFAGSMYSMANGENHYMSIGMANEIGKRGQMFSLKFLRSVWSKIKKYRPRWITKNFKYEFNFYLIK